MINLGRPLERRSALSWPIFGLSLAALIGAANGAAAGPTLPTGGIVAAGSAVIASPSGDTLTINQSSSRAIINWSSFSIGQAGAVQFDNGSGATLNRVTGVGGSVLDGQLSGTGSVYLINPNGVIIGKSGVVDVGGTFVASTLDVTNGAFMAGGSLTFTGNSTATAINYGKIGALGGDVALIAAKVENVGEIDAANGDAGLLAGYKVVMRDSTLSDGKFAVVFGGSATSATNSGVIQAAEAELRANGGNVYALAGNTQSIIKATGVSTSDGKVFLVAEGGTLTVEGSIQARGVGGTGGSIETSGQSVDLGNASIDAGQGGFWLIDPINLTIDSLAAGTIQTSLNLGTNVTVQTTATGSSGPGTATSGPGDIIVAAPITWSGVSTLDLSAYRNITVNAGDVITGSAKGAGLILQADNTGDGTGAVNFAGSGVQANLKKGSVQIFYNPTSYAAPTNYVASVSGSLNAYMLVNNLTNLQAISTNLTGAYALGRNIDASASATMNLSGGVYAGFAPIGNSTTPFAGDFNGEGHTITGLVINRPSSSYVGLFGFTSNKATIESIGLIGESVVGSFDAGGLVGLNAGTLSQSYATGAVAGSSGVGGLVGENQNKIDQSYSTASVLGGNVSASIGGLVGVNSFGKITNSYATGAVTGGTNSTAVGGLIGSDNLGTLKQTYATGAVTAGAGSNAVGGLVGSDSGGAATASYWDTQTTGQSTSALGVGLTTAQFFTASNFVGFTFGTTPGASGWVIVDADGSLNNAGGAAGNTRPMLLSEYSTTIVNLHQLQLMELDLGASYTLAANIDASPTADGNPSDLWTSAGFVPIGSANATLFTGLFNGQGHTISGLTFNRPTPDGLHHPSTDYIGLFGTISAAATVENVGLIGGSTTGGYSVGALVGVNFGTITQSYATGPVNGNGFGYFGGLVGGNVGTITQSYATGAVTGGSGSYAVGGLVGGNLDVGVVSQSYATGAVTGGDSVGGLAGYNDNVITQSYATGAVSGSSNVGGLVGGNHYNNGTIITQSYATGAVTGGNNVGGLAGYNDTVITQSYATGAVSGSTNVGGLLGINNGGSVTSSYWDTQTSGQAASAGGVGLTTAQMQNPASFAGWDFVNVWFPPSAGVYPLLRHAGPSGP